MLDRLNDAGKTIIMVTHEDDIAEHAKRIIRMRDGLIIDDGPSPRMLEAPGEAVATAGDRAGPADAPSGRRPRSLRADPILTDPNRRSTPWDASGAA